MAKRESRRKKTRWVVAVLVLAAVGFCVLYSVQAKGGGDFGLPAISLPRPQIIEALFDDFVGEPTENNLDTDPARPGNAGVQVHFIDVGQAKAILVTGPKKIALIDAGESAQGQEVVRYLKAQGVRTIDLLFATHPHADHIGGMSAVILGIPVSECIMPDIPDSLIPTSSAFTGFLEAADSVGLSISSPAPGEQYALGDGAVLTVLGPVDAYEDLNDMSLVMRLDYGKTSFLFTGDASAGSERDILKAGRALSADVLDVGHHGSETATTAAFLRAVNPQIAVISCGLDNSYGHPHREVMQRLEGANVKILRTDLDGSVVISSDGKSLGIDTEK